MKITFVYIDGTNNSWISTSGTETGLSCTPNSGYLIKLDKTVAKADWLYSILYTSFLNNSTVSVRTDTGSGGECVVGYVTSGTP